MAWLCAQCKQTLTPHCTSAGCGWVVCPTHLILRLPPKPTPPEAPDAA